MKILLIRFSSIGDIVLTSPVARCLKNQLGAEVHFLTKGAYASLIEPNPNIDKVFAFQNNVKETIPALRAERYDYVLDLHHNLRSLQVKLAIGRRASSFNKLNFEKWMMVNFQLDILPDRHIVHRYIETGKQLGLRYDGLGLDHFIPENAHVDVAGLSPHLKAGNFIAFAIGATHATKRLPQDMLLEICRKSKLPIILLGGSEEEAIGKYLEQYGGEQIIHLCNKLSIHQSASIIEQAGTVWTHDTGMMHIAAAFKKPIVSFWGSTTPKFGMYPFYPDGMDKNYSMELQGLACRPCSKIGFDACPQGHFDCMRQMDFGALFSQKK